jgi:hypothetical protein
MKTIRLLSTAVVQNLRDVAVNRGVQLSVADALRTIFSQPCVPMTANVGSNLRYNARWYSLCIELSLYMQSVSNVFVVALSVCEAPTCSTQ